MGPTEWARGWRCQCNVAQSIEAASDSKICPHRDDIYICSQESIKSLLDDSHL